MKNELMENFKPNFVPADVPEVNYKKIRAIKTLLNQLKTVKTEKKKLKILSRIKKWENI